MARQVKPYKDFGRYGSVGIELVLSILLGWWVGQKLDPKFGGGHGYITGAGFLLGVYAGFRALFVTAAHMQKDIERAERQERGEDPWTRPPFPGDPPGPTSRPAEAHHDDDPKRHDPR
jgi:hypothetical protein